MNQGKLAGGIAQSGTLLAYQMERLPNRRVQVRKKYPKVFVYELAEDLKKYGLITGNERICKWTNVQKMFCTKV